MECIKCITITTQKTTTTAAQKTTTTTNTSPYCDYTVQQRETLNTIAEKYLKKQNIQNFVKQVKELNQMKDDKITKGQILKIPCQE